MACADLTAAAVDAAWFTKVSVSCLRDGVGLDQSGVAIGLNVGVVGVGLRGGKIGFGLRHLLVEFGRVDDREQVALLHVCTDVEVPVHQIAIGARVDGRVSIGGHVAGQDKLVHGRAGFGRSDGHGRRSVGIRSLREHRIAVHPGQHAQGGEHDGGNEKHDHSNDDLVRRDRFLFGSVLVAAGRAICGWFGAGFGFVAHIE